MFFYAHTCVLSSPLGDKKNCCDLCMEKSRRHGRVHTVSCVYFVDGASAIVTVIFFALYVISDISKKAKWVHLIKVTSSM